MKKPIQIRHGLSHWLVCFCLLLKTLQGIHQIFKGELRSIRACRKRVIPRRHQRLTVPHQDRTGVWVVTPTGFRFVQYDQIAKQINKIFAASQLVDPRPYTRQVCAPLSEIEKQGSVTISASQRKTGDALFWLCRGKNGHGGLLIVMTGRNWIDDQAPAPPRRRPTCTV